MKVALAQMNPTVGDLRGNVLKIKEMAAKARDGGADLVIFPEMAVTGYPPHDLFLYRTFIAKVEEIIRDEILPQTEGIDPVSYTHLDVYKRQDIDKARRF